METMTPTEARCAVCGKPLTVQMPDLGLPATDPLAQDLNRLIKIVTHQGCYDRIVEKEDWAARMEFEAQQSQEWAAICPLEFRASLDHSLCPKARADRVMAWQYGSKGLLLYGRSGRCKTRLAYKLVEREFRAGRRVCALSHPTFKREVVARSCGDAPRDLIKWLALLSNVDLLLLDDIGKAKATEATEESFLELIDQRLSKQLPTIYTTQDIPDTLRHRFSDERGDAIMRRLSEACTPIFLQ